MQKLTFISLYICLLFIAGYQHKSLPAEPFEAPYYKVPAEPNDVWEDWWYDVRPPREPFFDEDNYRSRVFEAKA